MFVPTIKQREEKENKEENENENEEEEEEEKRKTRAYDVGEAGAARKACRIGCEGSPTALGTAK